MATTLSRYLRLKLDSNLTANAKYNLERIDALGSTFITDSSNSVNVRSEQDISIEPNSADLGGEGTGGTVSVGSDAHEIDLFEVYATLVNFSDSIGLLDSATSGTKYLRFKYKSDINGAVDTVSDRTISIDPEGADRILRLGGNLVLGGSFTTSGGNLSLTTAGNLALSIPANSAGYLGNDGTGTLSWVSISGAGDVLGASYTWLTADGTTKVVNHSLVSSEVEVSIYDESDDLIWIDSISIDSNSQITLNASEAPSSSWKIVLQAKP